jgi:ankyrin repeat protein
MLAAQGNAMVAFDYLLRAGADLNYKDSRGRTVATLARDNTLAILENWEQEHPSARARVATSGQKTDPSAMQQQKKGAAPDTGKQQGMSASEKLLLEVCSFKPGKSTIDSIVELIKMRADVNFEGQCDPSDMMTYTPLGRAIEQNLIKVAQVLLEKGADPSKKYGISDLSPLMHAAFENRPQIADMLVYYGANVNECDSSLHSALDYAKYKSPEVAKVLRSHNAKEDACKLLTTE